MNAYRWLYRILDDSQSISGIYELFSDITTAVEFRTADGNYFITADGNYFGTVS